MSFLPSRHRGPALAPWLLLCCLGSLHSPSAQAETPSPDSAIPLPPVVVTAPLMQTPLRTQIDPRAAQQPQPANDGASVLKALPGMGVIRKGGIDGDPVFRGMAASRLNILVDGEQILGGCGMRMDPPTAYVFPDAFNRVTLIKGPQTVRHGPGGSAGTVLFEREPVRFTSPGTAFDAAVGAGSFGRWDAFTDARAGTSQAHVQVQATQAESGEQRDGHGHTVHSSYRRHSLDTTLGWTPEEHTRVSLRASESRASAAYADRSMDGSRFDRSHLGLSLDRRALSPLVQRVEAQAYVNAVDHVMDNFSLRTPPANPAQRMASNPDRHTSGGRLAATLRPDDRHLLVLGLDQQSHVHTVRNSGMGGELASPYEARPRLEDARFDNLGVYGELTHALDDARRLVAGLRRDAWSAQDKRLSLSSGMASLGANPTAGLRRSQGLWSGFLRHERDWGEHTEAHIGLGHTERAPDYWELISKESANSTSAFASTRPEKTTQLDLGMVHRGGDWEAFASAYLSQVQDFILVQSQVSKPSGMGSRSTTIARNVDARTWGAEAGLQHAFAPQWTWRGSLAWAHGRNLSDGRPLGQIPPLEARLSLGWDDGRWSAGGLLRAVSAQTRYALNQGNIVGQDLGPAAGFAVASLHASWRWRQTVTASVGVDNLFDKAYAEFINRAGSALAGYDTTTRVNEPGRSWWVKLRVALD